MLRKIHITRPVYLRRFLSNQRIASSSICRNLNLLVVKGANPYFHILTSGSSRIYFSSFNWDEKKKNIFDAALTHVPGHGWTDQAIAQGVLSCGYPPSMMGLIPLSSSTSSCHALVEYFMQKSNHQLGLKLRLPHNQDDNNNSNDDDNTPKQANMEQRLIYAIQTRLAMNEPFVKTKRWSEGMALGILYPSHATVTSTQLEEIVNIIYEFSRKGQDLHNNDIKSNIQLSRAVDKGSIAILYIATELFMLTDNSDDFQDTWNFLKDRVKDLFSLQGTLQNGPWSSVVTKTPLDHLFRPEMGIATSAVVASLGGAILSLLTPAAKVGVGAIADAIIPQILSSVQQMNSQLNHGTDPTRSSNTTTTTTTTTTTNHQPPQSSS